MFCEFIIFKFNCEKSSDNIVIKILCFGADLFRGIKQQIFVKVSSNSFKVRLRMEKNSTGLIENNMGDLIKLANGNPLGLMDSSTPFDRTRAENSPPRLDNNLDRKNFDRTSADNTPTPLAVQQH